MKPDWQPLTDRLAQHMPATIRPWLTQSYILTQHLKAVTTEATHIEVLSQGRLTSGAWQRCICHKVADQAVVYAEVIAPEETYHALAKQLDHLGNKPLGETLLYHSDGVRRSPFEYAQLDEQDALYQAAQPLVSDTTATLWARRSTFYWQGLPLTITEVFLPAMPPFQTLSRWQQIKQQWLQKGTDYLHLIRLHRPIPILLMLWPTLMGLWVASEGWPGWSLLFIFIFGTFVMRSAGDIFNDLADRRFDGFIERTQMRPLATGRIRVRHALALAVLLVLVALVLVLQINRVTVVFAFIGLLLAILYPFMKRYTYWPQAVLGLAYNWGIILAFTAVTNTVPPIFAWVMWLSMVLWTIAYDTMYALADTHDDQRLGLKSTALLFGARYRIVIALFQVVTVLLWLLLGWWQQWGVLYFIAVLLSVPMFVYQQRLLPGQNIQRCIQAFNHNQWVGLMLFAAVVWQYARFM